MESEADREAILTRPDLTLAAPTLREETESIPERRKVEVAEGADLRAPTEAGEDLTPEIRGQGRAQAHSPENPKSLGQEVRSTAMTKKGRDQKVDPKDQSESRLKKSLM